MVIETSKDVILIDPMLSEKGSMPSFTEKRCNPQNNPIVELPESCSRILDKVTHCMITHLHTDHLDKPGEEFLIERNIPIICSILDEDELKKRGLKVILSLEYWKKTLAFGGYIVGIPALHGYGEVAKLMGKVMGYVIQLPQQPIIYLSSDTIFTDDVKNAIETFKPEIAVMASGTAQLDEYEPILMTLDDILAFTENAPKHVIANHLEAVNHCTTSRKMLKTTLLKKNLLNKVWIPNDGESREY
jgi:L-ascorbate metabolism protein UlaG (beta-lactamase superfamily)